MATQMTRRTAGVSGLIRRGYVGVVEVQPEGETPSDPRLWFGQVVRAAREQRDWTQEELAEHSSVSRPTIQRWEAGKTVTPDPENARKAFLVLGLDPRLIPVILGYVTAEEMDMPAQAPRVFTPAIERVIAILEDTSIPADTRNEWIEFLTFRVAQVQGGATTT